MREMTLDELVNHHGEIHRARTELIALHSRLTASEAQLCRVKKVLTELAHHWPKGNVYEVAIKDTAPCPHEAEVKRLRAAIDWVLESDECYALDYEDMVAELRRRAEGGK